MKRVLVDEFLAGAKEALLLDVRSPGEYNHAHIPGAVSLPLFSDEEWAVVGTAYKQQSRETAIKIGLDFFGPKMRGIVERVEELAGSYQLAVGNGPANRQLPTANSVHLYCWRGGMRSGAVAWLLNLYGFSVTVLAGGYKAFRNHVLQSFEAEHALNILGGYTGSGKTGLLGALQARGQRVVDLEALASHKGSAFGNLGMPPQPSQEMFENRLAWELLELNATQPRTPNPIWVEDESQRIGHVNIPKAFWETMRRLPVYFLDIPFDQRLQNLVGEYGGLDRERLKEAIQRIAKRLGGLETKNALQFLVEGNITECFRILLHYYDKQYEKGLANRDGLSTQIIKIGCATVGDSNVAALLAAQTPAHERTR